MVPYRLVLMRRELLPLMAKWTRKNMRRRDMIPILHFHLTDHCNLNCRGCDNFSPLAPDTFTETEAFEADCRRMAQLMGTRNRIKEIQLLGGEPLLHPQVTRFMDIARSCFPHTPINLVSNGLLLPKEDERFWECCRRNDVQIIVTKYPIKFDYHAMAAHVRAQGVRFSFYGNTEVVEKTMVCVPLDVEGRQNATDSFLRCARQPLHSPRPWQTVYMLAHTIREVFQPEIRNKARSDAARLHRHTQRGELQQHTRLHMQAYAVLPTLQSEGYCGQHKVRHIAPRTLRMDRL